MKQPTKQELKEQLDAALKRIEELEVLLGEKSKPIHNERNAGRKPIVGDATENMIMIARKQGKSIRELAGIYGLSVGLIHKIVKKHE